MNLISTDDQNMLVESVRRFLEDKAFTGSRGALHTLEDHAALWRDCADMGWFQVLVPEECGGLGLDMLAAAKLVEEGGRALLPLPLGEAIAAAPLLVAAGDGAVDGIAAAWLNGETYFGVVQGRCRETLSGQMPPDHVMADAGWAEYAPKGARALEWCIEGHHAALYAENTYDSGTGIDPLIATARLTSAESSLLARFPEDADDWARLQRRRRLLRLAEALGAAARVLDDATAYAKERVQFGQPIGANQAIKHRLADGWMALDDARLALDEACRVLDQDRSTDHAEACALMAQVLVLEAATSVGNLAVQVHGAMGITWECPVHFYLKRIRHVAAVLRHGQDTAAMLERLWRLQAPSEPYA